DKKATNLHPRLASEMEHMLRKLQELESQSDGLKLELKRKENVLNMLQIEREQLGNQISAADEHYSKEKQILIEDILEQKRKKEQKDREIFAKDAEILHAKQELEQQRMKLNNSEQAILGLQAKMKQLSEQQKMVDLQLSEKRKECLKVQSTIHEIEENILKRTAAMQKQITHELRNEISFLHQKMREKQLLADQDRLLRSNMMDDHDALTKENTTLQSRLLELIKQLDIERALKEELYTSHSAIIAQFLKAKDHEEHLQREIKRHQELLDQENKTLRDLEDKISILEKRNTARDLNIATMNSRVAEIKAMLDKEEQDNFELKRQKALLVDLTSSLQKQLAGKEDRFLQASNKMLQLDEAISALKTSHTLRRSLQSEKLGNISQMASSMKNLNKAITDIIVNMGKSSTGI
ncbi:hypothetical protein lerEdw1_005600, partial [Lerista edwardsae]